MRARPAFAVPFVALFISVAAVAYAAFNVGSVEVDVEVLEAISITPSEFAVFMFPGETEEASFDVCNDSSADLTITFTGGISPIEQGVTISLPEPDDVEGGACEEKSIDVVAAGDAVPQVYHITVSVGRE